MTNVFQYTDETKTTVNTFSGDCPWNSISRGHRFWKEFGVDVAEEAGEILAHDYVAPLSLEEAYTAKYAEINTWRDAEYADEDAVVTVDGINYDANPDSQTLISNYLTIDYAPESWTDADNNEVTPFTLAMLQAVQTAILDRTALIHARQRELKAELETLYATEGVTADEITALVVDYAVEEVATETTEEAAVETA